MHAPSLVPLGKYLFPEDRSAPPPPSFLACSMWCAVGWCTVKLHPPAGSMHGACPVVAVVGTVLHALLALQAVGPITVVVLGLLLMDWLVVLSACPLHMTHFLPRLCRVRRRG